MRISGRNEHIFELTYAVHHRLLQLAVAGLLMYVTVTAAGENKSVAYQYSSRPWPIRYFLYIADHNLIRTMNSTVAGMNLRVEQGVEKSIYMNYEEYFPPTKIIETPHNKLGIVLLTFAPDATLTSPSFNRFNFKGAQTGLGNLVLIKNEMADDNHKPYHVADWWELPGHHLMSPAVCYGADAYRYETDEPKSTDYSGGFGCREWAAKMQDADYPYIDVTSYYKADFHMIDNFVGWSSFENKPKPVIGKHFNTWVCLHDCPGGEQPGVIRDIQAWTIKHGFPMPTPPSRQPEFPNSMFQNIHEE